MGFQTYLEVVQPCELQESKKKNLCYVKGIVADVLFSFISNSFIFHLFLSLGIDIKKGRGRYIDTCMVTFAPRYLLDNKSTYKLAFVQREFARGRVRCFLLLLVSKILAVSHSIF